MTRAVRVEKASPPNIVQLVLPAILQGGRAAPVDEVKKEELKANEVNALTGAVMHEKSMKRHEKDMYRQDPESSSS